MLLLAVSYRVYRDKLEREELAFKALIVQEAKFCDFSTG